MSDSSRAAVPECFQQVNSIGEIPGGSIAIRKNEAKFQQGGSLGLNEGGDGLVVSDVLNLNDFTYLAEAGIIKPAEGDLLYRCDDTFANSSKADRAREVLQGWTLFQKYAPLQKDMLAFLYNSFCPEQILTWKKEEQLSNLFVPMQQKFKIGKFTEKVDYDKELVDRFRNQLSELYDGKHLTYVAFIPREKNKLPRFYSIGTKPHLETRSNLREHPGGFNPNMGGHIAVLSREDEVPKRFLVDAGSYDLGAGMQTSLAVAELVTTNLSKLYPDFQFKPVAGRGAHGAQQSY